MLKGIDVSNVQGNVDWRKVRDAGVRFAYLKTATGNEGLDPAYSHNLAGCRSNGVWAGGYGFAFPLPPDPAHPGREPKDQALHHFRLSGGIGKGPGELPFVVDLEWPYPTTSPGRERDGWAHWGCSAPQVADWLSEYLAEADALFEGPVGVYTFPWFWNAVWGAIGDDRRGPLCAQLARRPLWMASYASRAPAGPDAWPKVADAPRVVVEPWRSLAGQRSPDGLPLDWTFWQWGLGTVPGQGGRACDLDVANLDEAGMEKLAGGPA